MSNRERILKLRATRKQLGLSDLEAATAVGKSNRTYVKYESGALPVPDGAIALLLENGPRLKVETRGSLHRKRIVKVARWALATSSPIESWAWEERFGNWNFVRGVLEQEGLLGAWDKYGGHDECVA